MLQKEHSRREEVSPARRMIKVWDLPTRLFHWLGAALVAAAYGSWRLNWMLWHVRIGLALLALVIFRLLWGVWGSESARFSRFLASPSAAFRHLARLFEHTPDRETSHNPAGGWMVVVLLGLLLGETLSGVYVNNDIANESDLTEIVPPIIANAITDLHTILWWALVAAIALHIAAILVYAVAKGQNLTRPMLTGAKMLPPEIAPPRFAPLGRALALFAASIAAAFALGAAL